jgi:hypothetical protein
MFALYTLFQMLVEVPVSAGSGLSLTSLRSITDQPAAPSSPASPHSNAVSTFPFKPRQTLRMACRYGWP